MGIRGIHVLKPATPKPPRLSRTWIRDALICAGLAALTTVVYAPVYSFDFVNYDDPIYVVENPTVNHGLSLRGLVWAFDGPHESNWHPLTWLSLMLDASLYGNWAGGFHLTNLALHVANVCLVFLFWQCVTGEEGPSICVAALFAVHPQHVESVAWVTERKDVLSTLFGLLALIAYARYAGTSRRRDYAMMVVSFVLSLMSKQMFITFPLLLLLLDGWPLARFQALGWKRCIGEKIPLFILAAIFSGVALYAQSRQGALITLEQMSFPLRAANALVSCVAYLASTLWPMRLSFFYPRPVGALPWGQVLGAGMVLAAISCAVYWQRQRRPYLLFGWLWFLVALLPVIGLVQIASQARADRYMYVPHLGLFVLLVWGLRSFWPLGRRWLAPAATGWVVGLALICRQQVATWRDTHALAHHALALNPDNVMALITLGAATLKDSPQEALRYYQRAILVAPGVEAAHTGLGRAYRQLGQTDQALQEFERALQANPNWVGALSGRGRIRVERGDIAQGIDDFLKALSFEPDAYTIRNNLALAYFQLGQYEQSAEQFRLALTIEPDSVPMHQNLGLVCMKLGRFEEAALHFRQALDLGPPSPEILMDLSTAYGKLGRLPEAQQAYESAIKLEPKFRVPGT